MRQDIVKLIEGEKDITNAIVLTHNIDFVFIQAVVLPALRRCGHPSLTIFADAQCASESYQAQYMVLDSLGTRFRVVPVTMKPGFRFHPKAVLLSGQKKGVLLVGSGNLTFGGWRENAETWCRFDSDEDGTAPFSAFLEYLESVVALTPLRGSLTAEVNECFDGGLRPWAQNMESPDGLIGRPSGSNNLIDQMKEVLQEKPIQSLLIHSPYFDDGGHALRELSTQFKVKVKVAAQIKRSGLSTEAYEALGDAVYATTVNFQHRVAEDNLRTAFIHAKWYAFEHEDSFSIFQGSANCSQAALTVLGKSGNAELMTYASLTKEEFSANFTDELEFLDVEPQLSSLKAVPDQEDTSLPYLHVSAAWLDDGCLQIAYACSDEVSLQVVLLDGKSIKYISTESGVVIANAISADSRQVRLQGNSGAQAILSNLHWIDHEQLLSTTARSRSVVDAVRSKVQSQNWSIGAWSDIANVFLRNLQYMPKRMGEDRAHGGGDSREGQGQQHYTAEDVFSDSYGLPASHLLTMAFPAGFDDRVTSLRQLLMRWFGYKDEEDQESSVDGPDGDDGSADGDVVDRPERLPAPNPKNVATKSTRTVTENDRRRALKILATVTQQMTCEAYLSERQPETISVDIQFSSVLLRSGLCEKWITEEEFFESTHHIWSHLFFSSSPDPTCGWLEHRYKNNGDPDEFAKKLVSPKLTAALAAWVFAISEANCTPERSRFELAKILSVARLPWLWHYDDGEDVAKELQGLLASSTNTSMAHVWDDIQARWLSLIRNGYALRILEEKLVGKTPGDLKDQISQNEVNRGDLLWQGTGGLCVATENFIRSNDKKNTTILYLQKTQSVGVIRTIFAIPIKALLADGILGLSAEQHGVLVTMMDSLSAQRHLNDIAI